MLLLLLSALLQGLPRCLQLPQQLQAHCSWSLLAHLPLSQALFETTA